MKKVLTILFSAVLVIALGSTIGRVPITTEDVQTVASAIIEDGTVVGDVSVSQNYFVEPMTDANYLSVASASDVEDLKSEAGAVMLNETELSSTENDYYIETLDQWKEFVAVSKENSYAGMTVHLATDIEWDGTDFAGIGSAEVPFAGIFDGHGYAITKLSSTTNGLFVAVEGATIQNLSIGSAKIALSEATSDVGILVGEANGATIQNVVIASSKITSEEAEVSAIGGMIGKVSGVVSVSNAEVKRVTIKTAGVTSAVGGFIGQADAAVTMNACDIANSYVRSTYAGDSIVTNLGGVVGHASASIIATDVNAVAMNMQVASPVSGMGTIVGYMTGTASSFEKCSVDVASLTATTKENNHVGGFVGYVDSVASFANNYVTNAKVNAKANGSNVGGFVGCIGTGDAATTLTSCLVQNTTVSGKTWVGEVIGKNESANATIVAVYYHNVTASRADNAEIYTCETIAKATADAMASGETAWNLNTVNGTVANSMVWSQGNGPRFATETAKATIRIVFKQPSGTTYCYTDRKGNLEQPELDKNCFWTGDTSFTTDTVVESVSSELFYQNKGAVKAADPCVLTIGDTFYLYATNANGIDECTDIRLWTSKDLNNWTEIGPAFVPAEDSWAVDSLWAPEVIAANGKYYMYYSGYNRTTGMMGIGVAVSDSLTGPFHEIEGTFGGKTYSRTEQPIDVGSPIIDPNPFIDDDGSIYLYFVHDQVNKVSSIYGCKLSSDMVTVESVTEEPIVTPTVSDTDTKYWNEAPCMYKHGGKYYMIYSSGYYQSKSYCLGLSVSDNPLSGFARANYSPILRALSDWTHVSGTGHCSVFPSPDGNELWVAYHSHIDTENGGYQRKINFDRATFDASGRLVISGPSVTPQVLPAGVSNYGNIASKASVSATNDGKINLLTDGIVNYRTAKSATYEYSSTGTNTISFTFEEAHKIKGLMIYDGADVTAGGSHVSVAVGDSSYDMVLNSSSIPGSASILEIDETEASVVTFTFKDTVKLNEIVILAEENRPFEMTTNYFTEVSDDVYALTLNSAGDGGVDDVKRAGEVVREAFYSIKGKITLDTNADWTQARILVSSDPNNEHVIALERTDGTNYQIFAMSKDNEEFWNDWKLVSHAALNGADNSVDFEVIANGREVYFLIDDEICHTSDRVSMAESTVKFSCAVNNADEGASATTTVENLDGQIFKNEQALKAYLGTKKEKAYETQYEARINELYNEYIVDNGCAQKGGTLLLGHSHIDFWDNWEAQTKLTNYVNGYNVGIGGTTTKDWLYAYDKLVKPFGADRFVISVGENDVTVWGEDGEAVVERLEELFEKIHTDFPTAEIYYIYSLPSPTKYQDGTYANARYDALVKGEKALCEKLDYVQGVDTFELFLTEDGQNVNADLFAPDNVHLNEQGYQVWSEFLYDEIFKGENFGTTVGDGIAYKTTDGIELKNDKGENPTIDVFAGGPRYAYANDTYSDRLYFETEFTVKEVLNNDLWPKFGIILNGESESLKFFVDMTAEMTASMVGVVHQPTNGDDDWANAVSTNVSDMRFTNGDKVRLAVLRDGNAYYFYVNDQLVLSQENAFVDEKSAVGIFAFNTVLTASNYKMQKGENFGMVVSDGRVYKTTSGIDLKNDKGMAPSIDVLEGGPRYAYLNDTYSDRLYFETEINVKQVLNNDSWPKFGIILNGKSESLKFYVDMTAEMTATTVGVVHQPTNGDDDWANAISANVDDMRFTNEDKIKLAVHRDGNAYYFYVNDQLVLSQENAFIDEKSAVGIFAFNTVLTASDYKMNQGENFGFVIGDGRVYKTTSGIELKNDKGIAPTIDIQEGGPRYAYMKDAYSNKLYFETEINVKEVLNDDRWPKFGIILNGKNESLKFFVDMTAEMTATTVGVVHQPTNGDDDWANVVSANVENMKFTNEDKIKLAVLRDGNAYYFYVNEQLVLSQENAFADEKSAVGIFAFNTVLTAKNYTVLKDEAVVEKIEAVKVRCESLLMSN